MEKIVFRGVNKKIKKIGLKKARSAEAENQMDETDVNLLTKLSYHVDETASLNAKPSVLTVFFSCMHK